MYCRHHNKNSLVCLHFASTEVFVNNTAEYFVYNLTQYLTNPTEHLITNPLFPSGTA